MSQIINQSLDQIQKMDQYMYRHNYRSVITRKLWNWLSLYIRRTCIQKNIPICNFARPTYLALTSMRRCNVRKSDTAQQDPQLTASRRMSGGFSSRSLCGLMKRASIPHPWKGIVNRWRPADKLRGLINDTTMATVDRSHVMAYVIRVQYARVSRVHQPRGGIYRCVCACTSHTRGVRKARDIASCHDPLTHK